MLFVWGGGRPTASQIIKGPLRGPCDAMLEDHSLLIPRHPAALLFKGSFCSLYEKLQHDDEASEIELGVILDRETMDAPRDPS